MAKRKRLTAANPAFLDPAPEAKSGFPMRAPIADVAREASSTAAVEEMAQTLRTAREEGRMVISVSLDDIQTNYLVRDRVAVLGEEQAALIESIARRGQQTPVELVDLGEDAAPRYGLISGWRRVMALKELRRGLGARYDSVLGLLRRPQESSEAYLAMIEENEIRVGLSYFERARIALKAVEQGAFPDAARALAVLYENASRAKRSKIKSFMTVVTHLDGVLLWPAAIGERLGLQLAQALETEPGLKDRLHVALKMAGPADHEAEQSLIRSILSPKPEKAAKAHKETAPGLTAPLEPAPDGTMHEGGHEGGHEGAHALPSPVRKPVHLRVQGRHQLVLEGSGVDAAFRADLEAWLADRQG